MNMESIIGSRELGFLLDLSLALVCGILIGLERELKGKPAGISTQTLVITGAMMFAFFSRSVDGGDPTRIAAQIVSGVGFLGAGIILKSEKRARLVTSPRLPVFGMPQQLAWPLTSICTLLQ